MLERLLDRWASFDGVEFVTMAEAAEEFRQRYPFGRPNRPECTGR